MAGEELQDLVAALGIVPGLGKDLSKIAAFESWESSPGADAIGWSCRVFLRSKTAVDPGHLTREETA